jgi:hypothetical protein
MASFGVMAIRAKFDLLVIELSLTGMASAGESDVPYLGPSSPT